MPVKHKCGFTFLFFVLGAASSSTNVSESEFWSGPAPVTEEKSRYNSDSNISLDNLYKNGNANRRIMVQNMNKIKNKKNFKTLLL